MTKTIEVDGVTYAPLAEHGDIKIVVLERGFVYVGRVLKAGDDVTITQARCLIRWGTTTHLGELASGPLEGTKLGSPCTIRVRQPQIIYMVEVFQNGWQLDS